MNSIKSFLIYSLAILTIATISSASADDDVTTGTGNELIKQCNAHNYQAENDSWAFCVGYVHGVTEGYENVAITLFPSPQTKLDDNTRLFLKTLSYEMVKSFCMPDNSTREQTALVVSKYLSDNPDKLNLISGQLVLAAVRQAWPCDKKN